MNTTARYFIFARVGRAVVSVERDVNEMGLTSTLNDLIDGQIDKPVSVFRADDNQFSDVTEDIARLIADQGRGIQLSQPVLEFIAEHVGLRAAYALGMEAA